MHHIHRKFIALVALTMAISCTKSPTDPNNNNNPPIVYNYKDYQYIGNTLAYFEDVVNGNTTIWDTLYFDTLLVRVDSAKDRIVFIVNKGNPVGVYPQFEYPFAISSNYFRETFIHNYYQSFFFEGDTLKSYFYRLQVGANVSYKKEISFSGYLAP